MELVGVFRPREQGSKDSCEMNKPSNLGISGIFQPCLTWFKVLFVKSALFRTATDHVWECGHVWEAAILVA